MKVGFFTLEGVEEMDNQSFERDNDCDQAQPKRARHGSHI